MKFYIASRAKKAGQIKNITKKLEKMSYSIIFDWAKQPFLQPYDKNLKRSVAISKRMLTAIKKCDIFIILTDRAGTGMHAEFGAALSGDKKIFVVGKHLNTNIFFFYPNVRRVNSIDGLLKLIKRI